MSEYEQIVTRAKEQNINLEDKLILIPREENRFSINGDLRFGRVFEDTAIAVILRDVDCQYSPNGVIEEPLLSGASNESLNLVLRPKREHTIYGWQKILVLKHVNVSHL